MAARAAGGVSAAGSHDAQRSADALFRNPCTLRIVNVEKFLVGLFGGMSKWNVGIRRGAMEDYARTFACGQWVRAPVVYR